MRKIIFMTICLLILAGCGAGQGQESAAESVAPKQESAAAEQAEILSRDIFAMDTYMTISAYGEEAEEALDEAEAELVRLDALLAAEAEDSEVAQINRRGGGTVSDDTWHLITRAKEIRDMTGGAFEIALYPVKRLWGFTDQNYRVPDAQEIAALLPLADSDKIALDAQEQSVRLEQEGMAIDLGGIAKGYASSRLAEIFEAHQVKGLVNLGGNVQARGEKPDGSDWRVGIRMPEAAESTGGEIHYIGVLTTHDDAVITSGGYERYFEQDGKIYHHILDPNTGCPSEADLISVTIVAEDGTLADGLSTALYVLGLDKASDIWAADPDAFDMILVDRDGALYATEGLEGRFSSDLEITWIHRY